MSVLFSHFQLPPTPQHSPNLDQARTPIFEAAHTLFFSLIFSGIKFKFRSFWKFYWIFKFIFLLLIFVFDNQRTMSEVEKTDATNVEEEPPVEEEKTTTNDNVAELKSIYDFTVKDIDGNEVCC